MRTSTTPRPKNPKRKVLRRTNSSISFAAGKLVLFAVCSYDYYYCHHGIQRYGASASFVISRDFRWSHRPTSLHSKKDSDVADGSLLSNSEDQSTGRNYRNYFSDPDPSDDIDFFFDGEDFDDYGTLLDDEGDDEVEEDVGETTVVNILSNVTSITMDELISLSTSNVSYFYLRDELGLSETALWRITYEASSVLGMRTENIRKKVENLRTLMGFSDEDIRILIERQPALLQLSADNNVSPTVEYLLSNLELTVEELRKIVLACPALISYSRSNLRAKIQFFRSVIGLSTGELKNLWLKEPKLIRSGVKTGLIPHVRFLRRDIEFERDDLLELVQKYPKILILSLDQNLIPKIIFFLLMTLQLDIKQIQKILLTSPTFLDYNLESHILPMTKYFSEIEISPIEFGKILLKYPKIVSHSQRKIKHTLGYLRFELGLHSPQCKRVIHQAPPIFGLSNLPRKVSFLRDRLSLSDEEVRTVISGMPTLLILGIDQNLSPKIQYLEDTMKDSEKVREAVLRLPTLLGYSLANRIRPRMEALIREQVDPSSITVGIPMKEENFKSWLQRKSTKAKKSRQVTQETVQESNGRVIHWTRPRRNLDST